MARLNPNKLRTIKNYTSIWNSEIWNTSQYILEDSAIRKYIEGTLKKYNVDVVRRKVRMRIISNIIIKRKVNSFHIILQYFSKGITKRKRITKNRLKNRIKYRAKMLALRRSQRKVKFYPLYYLAMIIQKQLENIYPNNKISLYIQRIRPIELNSKMIADWIINRSKKKRSYHRLINMVENRFERSIKTSLYQGRMSWWKWDSESKKVFISWYTQNCLDYLKKSDEWKEK